MPAYSDLPQIRRRIGITYVYHTTREIEFDTDKCLAEFFARFGRLDRRQHDNYRLTVDGRYDFHEVLKYISHFVNTLD